MAVRRHGADTSALTGGPQGLQRLPRARSCHTPARGAPEGPRRLPGAQPARAHRRPWAPGAREQSFQTPGRASVTAARPALVRGPSGLPCPERARQSRPCSLLGGSRGSSGPAGSSQRQRGPVPACLSCLCPGSARSGGGRGKDRVPPPLKDGRPDLAKGRCPLPPVRRLGCVLLPGWIQRDFSWVDVRFFFF